MKDNFDRWRLAPKRLLPRCYIPAEGCTHGLVRAHLRLRREKDQLQRHLAGIDAAHGLRGRIHQADAQTAEDVSTESGQDSCWTATTLGEGKGEEKGSEAFGDVCQTCLKGLARSLAGDLSSVWRAGTANVNGNARLLHTNDERG